MTTKRKIGTVLIILGVAMFLTGGSLFSYQGPRLNPIISDIGMISFMLWLPTLIIGIVLVTRRQASKGTQNQFYEGEEGKRYFFSKPETPECIKMFIVSGNATHRLIFLTEEGEESFFDFPEKE